MAKTEHIMEDIFREALSSHEMDVSPKVWSGIESAIGQAGAGATGAAGGSAFLAKTAAVIGFAGLLTVATIAEINYHTQVEQGGNEVIEQVEAIAPTTATEQTVTAKELTEEPAQTQEASVSATELAAEVKSLPEFEKKEKPSGDQTIAISETLPAVEPVSEETGTPSKAAESLTNEGSKTAVATNEPDQGKPDVEASAEDKNKARPDQENMEEEEEETVQASATAYFSHEATQIITPNGDGYNDFMTFDGYGVDEFNLRIFTRSGHTVYETNDMEVRWTGVDRAGNALPSGVYYFQVQAVGTDGLPYMSKNAKGSVTIKR